MPDRVELVRCLELVRRLSTHEAKRSSGISRARREYVPVGSRAPSMSRDGPRNPSGTSCGAAILLICSIRCSTRPGGAAGARPRSRAEPHARVHWRQPIASADRAASRGGFGVRVGFADRRAPWGGLNRLTQRFAQSVRRGSASRVFDADGHSVGPPRRRVEPENTPIGPGPWESTAATVRWCSRSNPAATDCRGHKVHLHVRRQREASVRGHLDTAVPSQGAT